MRAVAWMVALSIGGGTLARGEESAAKIVAAARAQVGVTVIYDPSYQTMEYPDGDVPEDRGVCTDVAIRTLRAGLGIDLQKRVHEDMKANFSKYPKIWGLKGTDRNIDHRRVPNLRRYFERQGWELAIPEDLAEYRPGELVTCTVPPHLPHIMVVSDKKTKVGVPLVIHNIGNGAQEEDVLGKFEITGRYWVVEKNGR